MRLVVSFTTIPSRLPLIAPVVRSLRRQTVAPACIYLVLPLFSAKEQCAYPPLPREVAPWVRLLEPPEDVGPISKLVPVLLHEQAPDTLIVTVDDDMFYYPEMLEDLLRGHAAHPRAAVGCSGFVIGCAARCWWQWTLVGDLRAHDWHEAVPVDFLQGTDGVLFRRGMFPHDLRTWERDGAPRGARNIDDVWINGILALHGVARKVVYSSRSLQLSASQIRPLHGTGFEVPFLLANVRLCRWFRQRDPRCFRERLDDRVQWLLREQSVGFVVASRLFGAVLMLLLLVVVARLALVKLKERRWWWGNRPRGWR